MTLPQLYVFYHFPSQFGAIYPILPFKWSLSTGKGLAYKRRKMNAREPNGCDPRQ